MWLLLNILKKFLFCNEPKWHLVTFSLCLLLVLIILIVVGTAYKSKKPKISSVCKAFRLFNFFILSVLIFRTLYLHYALAVWSGIYLFFNMLYVCGKNKSINKSYYTPGNKGFFNYLKIIISLSFKRDSEGTAKKFLPFACFMIGLIYPCINFLVYGSQYSYENARLLRMAEPNLIIITALWLLYPVCDYLAVKIETGIMYDSKLWFNIGYFSFAFIILFALNGILALNIF